MADNPTSWGAVPAEAEGPAAWGAVPASETGTKTTPLSSYLPAAISDIPAEMWRSTKEAAGSARDLLLPKEWGGQRDPAAEGTFESIGKTGSGVLAAASVPFAPAMGVWRSLAGHSLESVDNAMRAHAVKLYGEDKVREVERYLGKPEGGTTYEREKANADLALEALAPGRGGLPALHSPAPVPVAPTPTGPLGVTLSEGQLTRDLPAIRAEQAAQRGQLGPDAERVAKAFNEQQATEVAAAREQVARGLDPFGARVAETPQEAGTLVSDAMQREAALRKAGVQQAYDYANALPGEIDASAFKTMVPDIKHDLTARSEPIIVDDKLTPFANRALADLEQRIPNLDIPNRALPLGQPPQNSISGVTLKGVEQLRKRLSTFRRDAWATGNSADGRAASAIVDAFDSQIDQAVRGGFFQGDPRAVRAWLDARAAHADYKGTFSASKGDQVGRVVEKIIGGRKADPAIPNDVADFLYGSSGVNPNSLNVGVAKRVRGILGDQSPEWSGVKQGLFSRIVEPPPGVTEWGPTKVAQRVNKFLNGDGKEMSETVFSAADRALIKQYADLQHALEIPPSAVNRSETSTFMVRALRQLGSKIGLVIGGAIGRAVLPGLPPLVSEGIGAVTAGGISKVADKLQARKISRQMPLVANALRQYQRAVAKANRASQPLSTPTIGIAAANLAQALQPLGIGLRDIGLLPRPVPGRAEDDQTKP